MANAIRNFARKQKRMRGDHNPISLTQEHDDHSISSYHPTKGWRRNSGKRMAASFAMARLLDRPVKQRTKRKPKVYKEQALRAAFALVTKRKFPQPITRQQKRYAQRKGIDLPA